MQHGLSMLPDHPSVNGGIFIPLHSIPWRLHCKSLRRNRINRWVCNNDNFIETLRGETGVMCKELTCMNSQILEHWES